MPGPIRKPLQHRSNDAIITPEAIAVFERGKRCLARGDDDGLSDASYQLALALRLKPWNECPFDTIGESEPPAWETSEFARTDWRRSKALADQLEQALRDKRKAEREARRAQPQPQADQSPPG